VTLPSLDPMPIFPPIHQLGQSLALGHAREFACVAKAITPLAPTPTFFEIISTLQTLHPSSLDFPCLDSLVNFQSNVDLELPLHSFRLAFMCLSHLLAGGPLNMVFKHLQDFFNIVDSTSGFI